MEQHQQNRYEDEREPTFYESCLTCCGWCCGFLRIWCPCICCCCTTPIHQLPTSESGILQRFGRFKKILTPGINIINPVTDTIVMIDMKTKVATMPRQPVITKDNITLHIQTAVYYRVVDSFKVAYKLGSSNQGALNFIAEMSQAALRSVGGEHTLQDMLSNREKIAHELQRFVENQVEPWGLLIENIFLKDLVLDVETQRNLSAAAKQKRLSEAAIISAQADVESAKMLKEAAEILDSKAAMQIRYLEMITEIAQKPTPKLMFLNLRGKE